MCRCPLKKRAAGSKTVTFVTFKCFFLFKVSETLKAQTLCETTHTHERLESNVWQRLCICMLSFEQQWLQDIDGFRISLLLIVISCNVGLRATIGREGDRDGRSINLFLMRPKIDIPACKCRVCIHSSVSKQPWRAFELMEIKLEKSASRRPDFPRIFKAGCGGGKVCYIICRWLFLRLDVLTAKFWHSGVAASCWQVCQEKKSVRLATYEKGVLHKSSFLFS